MTKLIMRDMKIITINFISDEYSLQVNNIYECGKLE